MMSFPTNFKETQLFHMHKRLLNRLSRVQSMKELTRFLVLFSSEELKEIIRNKLNEEIERGEKNENNTDFYFVQNKIRDVYLCTGSFDEILPTTVQLHILSFLGHDSFKSLPFLSKYKKKKEFKKSKHVFFYFKQKKYTLTFIEFKERNTSIFQEQSTSRKNTEKKDIEHEQKPKRLCVEHKANKVMIKVFIPEAFNENVDSKVDDTVSALDRLGQFPWHSIRKWNVNGQYRFIALCLIHVRIRIGGSLCRAGKH
ncbi:hypothetical protein RFI_38345 [Reticulomyxa filosa]|uniref:Uncharacterized protein n=1 Tax=Reticulomyxa filosa TaxID=46433 RepID=X6LAT2_RETFI|nr:hypothetical protein RFI_38345 [Reticulomyxa filosa]|eukprot:ETN99137.1 hypothetical protein RFI_38345 [Reticulomyxa filosa]